MSVENPDLALKSLLSRVPPAKIQEIRLAKLNYTTPEYPPEYLVSGCDSFVFKIWEFVVKNYGKGPLFHNERAGEILNNYMNATNRLASVCGEKGIQIQTLNGEFRVFVNPILKIAYSEEYGCWVTVSPFVDGMRSNQLTLVNAVNRDVVQKWQEDYNLAKLLVLDFNMSLKNPNKVIITDICPSPSLLAQTK